MRALGVMAAVVATIAVPGTAADLDATRQGITRALSDSAAAWSAGDLNRFMTCYEDDPATSYVSGGGRLVTGYRAIRDMYAQRFGGGSRAAMGALSVDVESLRLLGPDYAYVVGRFHVHRAAADGGDATGLTTLLFHHRAGRWLIVADHS